MARPTPEQARAAIESLIKAGQYGNVKLWIERHPEDFPDLDVKDRILAQMGAIQNYLTTDEARDFREERESAEWELSKLQSQIDRLDKPTHN